LIGRFMASIKCNGCNVEVPFYKNDMKKAKFSFTEENLSRYIIIRSLS
jgi:hypothetical protein